jgi:hypothetical protein
VTPGKKKLHRNLKQLSQFLRNARTTWSSSKHWEAWTQWRSENGSGEPANQPNALWDFFESRKEGRGIWKWSHYFPIYERHFARFRGREVHVLEVGIYSGGSLELWSEYFGPRCHVYGVDIAPSCRAYENDHTKIFIGDQADRGFWRQFKRQVPRLDIVIDDGGHQFGQQVATLEELLPHLWPGGVYLCEDVHQKFNQFASYVYGLEHDLNGFDGANGDVNDSERRIACPASPFQSAVSSVHAYPYVFVIERTQGPIREFVAPKHGTQWEPFLK